MSQVITSKRVSSSSSKLVSHPFKSDQLDLSFEDIFRILIGKKVSVGSLNIKRSGIFK